MMTDLLQPLIVGAPFGNWISFPGATSTVGTFTLKYRGGKLHRLWRCLLTLRYSTLMRGWVNRLGLPNPGIYALDRGAAWLNGHLVSIHGFNAGEWDALEELVRGLMVEYNVSCPNASPAAVDEVLPAIRRSLEHCPLVVAKLPPIGWRPWQAALSAVGVKVFHLCNTLPTPSGGLSGPVLKQHSLDAIRDTRRLFFGEQPTLIGGGGVYGRAEYDEYMGAGADHVAVASALLNPFNWRRIRRLAAEVAEDGVRACHVQKERQPAAEDAT